MPAEKRAKFISEEIMRFDPGSTLPFRVAVSSNFNGSDYPYGSHTERREYADSTIGYAETESEARELLWEAWEEAEERNFPKNKGEEK